MHKEFRIIAMCLLASVSLGHAQGTTEQFARSMANERIARIAAELKNPALNERQLKRMRGELQQIRSKRMPSGIHSRVISLEGEVARRLSALALPVEPVPLEETPEKLLKPKPAGKRRPHVPSKAEEEEEAWEYNIGNLYLHEYSHMPRENFGRWMKKERRALEPILKQWAQAQKEGDNDTERRASRQISERWEEATKPAARIELLKERLRELPTELDDADLNWVSGVLRKISGEARALLAEEEIPEFSATQRQALNAIMQEVNQFYLKIYQESERREEPEATVGKKVHIVDEVEAPVQPFLVPRAPVATTDQELQRVYTQPIPNATLTWEALAGKTWEQLTEQERDTFALVQAVFVPPMHPDKLRSWVARQYEAIAMYKQAVAQGNAQRAQEIVKNTHDRYDREHSPGGRSPLPAEWGT